MRYFPTLLCSFEKEKFEKKGTGNDQKRVLETTKTCERPKPAIDVKKVEGCEFCFNVRWKVET